MNEQKISEILNRVSDDLSSLLKELYSKGYTTKEVKFYLDVMVEETLKKVSNQTKMTQ